MPSREYSQADYAACRYIHENTQTTGYWQDQYTSIDGVTLTTGRVERLRRLVLVDGDIHATRTGELVRLSGLGVKTAEEAIRLGIASL